MREDGLSSLLYPIRRRLIICGLLRAVVAGLFWSFVAGAVLRLVVPSPHLYMLMALPLLLFLVGVLLKLPTKMDAARRADRCGLKERCRTALEFAESESQLSILQRQDARMMLARLDPKDVVDIRPPRSLIMRMVAGLLVFSCLLLINPLVEAGPADDSQQFKEDAEAEVAGLLEEIERQEHLPGERTEEIKKVLEELQRKLAEAESKEETGSALAKAASDLHMIAKDEAGQAQLLEEQSQVLADMIESGTYSLAGLNQLANQIAPVSPELAEMLRDAAAELALEGKEAAGELLQQALEKARSLVAAGQAAGLAGKYADQLGKLAGAAQEGSPGPGGSGPGGSGSGSGAEGEGAGGEQGAGSGTGTGGQGREPGGGAGGGHSPGSEEGGESTGSDETSGGSGTPTSDVGEYEAVFAPEHLGGEGEDSYLPQTGGDSGDFTGEYTYGPGDGGAVRPYNEVIATYAARARESLTRGTLPPGVQNIVWEYFTSLDEGSRREN